MQLVSLIGFTKRNGYNFMQISLLEINSNLSTMLKINFNDFTQLENFIDFAIEKTLNSN